MNYVRKIDIAVTSTIVSGPLYGIPRAINSRWGPPKYCKPLPVISPVAQLGTYKVGRYSDTYL